MSRIGKKPISVPSGVKVTADAKTRTVNVEGPKGRLNFVHPAEVTVAIEDGGKTIRCSIPESQMESGQARAFWGTTRARIANMLAGVTQNYVKKLEVVGVGWNAKLQGKTLQMSVGYCNPINLSVPDGVTVVVENGVNITVSSADRQAVGQMASMIRATREPEPYNGKGVKYSDEVIQRKAGKAFGAAGAA